MTEIPYNIIAKVIMLLQINLWCPSSRFLLIFTVSRQNWRLILQHHTYQHFNQQTRLARQLSACCRHQGPTLCPALHTVRVASLLHSYFRDRTCQPTYQCCLQTHQLHLPLQITQHIYLQFSWSMNSLVQLYFLHFSKMNYFIQA